MGAVGLDSHGDPAAAVSLRVAALAALFRFWAPRLRERVFRCGKLGARLPIVLLSFLQLRFFVAFFVVTVSSCCTDLHQSGSAREVPDFKHGKAYRPPPRPLKTLRNETPVPLFARSRLSEFKRGRTRASMRPRAPLLQSASPRSPCASLCGRIGEGPRGPPTNGAVPTGANWGSHHGRRNGSPTIGRSPRQPPQYQESHQ